MSTEILTLPKAVYLAITETLKLNPNAEFSAYEITTYIRNKANSKAWSFPGLESSPNPFNVMYNIPHADVRGIVRQLHDSGELNLLGLSDVSDNGKFLTYHFSSPSQVSIATPDPIVPDVSATLTLPVNQKLSPSIPDDASIVAKAINYIDRYDGAEKLTLKKIQSALKFKGLTCQKLEDVLVADGTFGVVLAGETPSNSYIDL